MSAAAEELHATGPVVWTERRLLDRLRERHARRHGNGPAWVYMEHVRDRAGFDARRTIDALAMHLWPSKRHALHAFEVKVARSDWLRELANPEKARAWAELVDYFWVVAPPGVIKVEELPPHWGLLVANRNGGLTPERHPERLGIGDESLTRSAVAAMLRAAQRTGGIITFTCLLLWIAVTE